MAGATITLQKSCPSRPIDLVRQQLNQLIADFDTLAVKLNADGGVTDTNYAVTTACPVLVK